MTDFQVHESHDPEPDGQRLYSGGRTCRRCCRFVAFEGAMYRITPAGLGQCRPAGLELRGVSTRT